MSFLSKLPRRRQFNLPEGWPKPKRKLASGDVHVPVWLLVILSYGFLRFKVSEVISEFQGHHWIGLTANMLFIILIMIVVIGRVFPKMVILPSKNDKGNDSKVELTPKA